MKKICFMLVCLFTLTFTVNAQNKPLRVGITHYSPPFVMQGANRQAYGFDIATMEYICSALQRPCLFQTMRFDQLLDAVIANKIDAAVAAITITPERSQVVGFSTPYLVSKSQFLTTEKYAKQPFSIQLLSDKTIGVESGSVFGKQITEMGIKNPNVISFETEEELIDALSKGNIDFALVDSASAQYWQSDTTEVLQVIGQPLSYGYGFGIAINKNNATLLQAVNQALVTYENSDQFKKNYTMYLDVF